MPLEGQIHPKWDDVTRRHSVQEGQTLLYCRLFCFRLAKGRVVLVRCRNALKPLWDVFSGRLRLWNAVVVGRAGELYQFMPAHNNL